MADRSRIFVAVCGLAVATACAQSNDVAPAIAPAPTVVMCGDGPQLRQRALEERRLKVETTSDQETIVAGSRATFYMSLALVADLQCKVASADADAALALALTAAHEAEGAGSFYERAAQWSDAGVAASEAVALLIEQLSTPQL